MLKTEDLISDKIFSVLIPTDPIASVESNSSRVIYCDQLISAELRWEDPLEAYEGLYP